MSNAHPDDFGSGGDPPQRIDDQCPAQADALRGLIDGKPSQDDHRPVVTPGALHHPAGGVGRGDAASRERVVTHHPTVGAGEAADHGLPWLFIHLDQLTAPPIVGWRAATVGVVNRRPSPRG